METKKQDIRIVQLKHFYGNMPRSGKNALHTFSYFDEIYIEPVLPDPANSSQVSLLQIYSRLTELWSINPNAKTIYRTQQTIIAVADIRTKKEEEKTTAFWSDCNKPWFFLTMINVPISTELKKAVAFIENKLGHLYYLIYYSFEFNEILLFCKTNSFSKYLEAIATLNYGSDDKETAPILDTVTICAFQKDCNDDTEMLNAHISLGVTNTNGLNAFIHKWNDSVQLRSKSIIPYRMLGRNDCYITLSEITLSQLKEAFNLYYKWFAKENPWISTYEVTLTAATSDLGFPQGQTSLSLLECESKELITAFDLLKVKVDELIKEYEQLCDNNGIGCDHTFIRIIREMGIMLKNPLVFQLASDLIICLLAQLLDFTIFALRFLRNQSSVNESHSIIMDTTEDKLENLINCFYLNVNSFVSSTVHSARQFIQIPHCGATALEMPPKTMAYYSIMTHIIASALNDCPNAFYGIMLSPKLVNELEVTSLSSFQTRENDHMLSISISEKMLYDPVRTLSIFGHEIAHYVGYAARCRAWRLHCISTYYIHKYLQDFFETYRHLIGVDLDNSLSYLDSNALLDFSDKLTSLFWTKSNDEYNKTATIFSIKHEMLNLHNRMFDNIEAKSMIFSCWIYNNNVPILFANEIKRELRKKLFGSSCENVSAENNSQRPFLESKLEYEYTNKAFNFAIDQFKKNFYDESSDLSLAFDSIVGYLFKECYADISMVMLYELNAQEYAELFFDNNKFDDLELARIHAVARVMQKKGVWTFDGKHMEIQPAEAFGSSNCADHITALMYFCLQANWNPEFSNIISNHYAIDWPLQSVLITYLTACTNSLETVLKANETYVAKARKFGRTLNIGHLSSDVICEIHQLEWDYLTRLFDGYKSYK